MHCDILCCVWLVVVCALDERTSRAPVLSGIPRTTELSALRQKQTQEEQLRLAVERGDYGRAAALATALDREQQQQQRGAAAAERLRASVASGIDSERLTSIVSSAGRSGLSCVKSHPPCRAAHTHARTPARPPTRPHCIIWWGHY